jgi:hypothetical protein
VGPTPTYALLCEMGSFLGRDGFDEVYELDGRLFAVAEDPAYRDSYPAYVYAWKGERGRLTERPSRHRGKSAA